MSTEIFAACINGMLLMIVNLIIIGTAWGILRETISILLQFLPRSVSFDEVFAEIRSVDGVEDVHHLHLWSLCSNIRVFDTLVYSCIRDVDQIERMKPEIKERLRKYQILYSTLEFECNICPTCSIVEEIRSHPECNQKVLSFQSASWLISIRDIFIC